MEQVDPDPVTTVRDAGAWSSPWTDTALLNHKGAGTARYRLAPLSCKDALVVTGTRVYATE